MKRKKLIKILERCIKNFTKEEEPSKEEIGYDKAIKDVFKLLNSY